MTYLEDVPTTYELDLDDDAGRPHKRRIEGWKIAQCDVAEVLVTTDGRVLAYAPADYVYNDVSDDPETALRDILMPTFDGQRPEDGYVETYADAMRVLGAETYLLDLIDAGGRPYVETIVGAKIADSAEWQCRVFLTTDQDILIVDDAALSCWKLTDDPVETLRGIFMPEDWDPDEWDRDSFLDAMLALGSAGIVEL